jgi:hypothetical protein
MTTWGYSCRYSTAVDFEQIDLRNLLLIFAYKNQNPVGLLAGSQPASQWLAVAASSQQPASEPVPPAAVAQAPTTAVDLPPIPAPPSASAQQCRGQLYTPAACSLAPGCGPGPCLPAEPAEARLARKGLRVSLLCESAV